jgi:hypothetical protein
LRVGAIELPRAAPPGTGRIPELTNEHARHVALIGEAGDRGCIRQGLSRANEHARPFRAMVKQPCVRRQPELTLEPAENLILAESSDLRQLGQPRSVKDVIHEAVAYAPEIGAWDRGNASASVTANEQCARSRQCLFACERAVAARLESGAVDRREESLENSREFTVVNNWLRDLECASVQTNE